MENNEPNYKVLATTTIEGETIQLREYKKHWAVAHIDTHGNVEEQIRDNYHSAEMVYIYAQIYKAC